MLWIYELPLGVAIVVLFWRLSRWDGENPRIWAPLAGIGWFATYFSLGVLWSIPVVGVLFAALLYRKVTQDPKGGKVR